MRTIIVVALVLIVGGLAAFNFSGLPSAPASDPPTAGAPSSGADLPTGTAPAENVPAADAAAAATAAAGDSPAEPTEDVAEVEVETAPERVAEPVVRPRADAAGDDAARVAAARDDDDDDERRRRSRWYRRPEPDLTGWTRPEGPPRIALQAGHWKAAEAPDEQAGLRTNGTRGGGKAEWEVNLAIARRTAALLEAEGFTVDVLPTTIPPNYFADVFVSIHADGNNSTSVSGYRAASPRRDRTGRAESLAQLLTRTYGESTGLPHYPTITRRMRSYYAFNYRRYEHSLHPMTVGVILETGFLTNPRDRRVIVDAPDRAARGIADAIAQFLTPPPSP